ncbi:MAG TPA: creatininase family protein [Thermomicrobiales bacterium]|nr:creatininase family protein [Thermomicrobiales bacterium]
MTDRVNDGTEVRWQKLRREQVAAASAAGGTVVVPIGSIEQHGPHLPLDTDTDAVTAVALRAARQVTDPPVLVLPPVSWGLSPYWLPFSGTLSLRPETILALFNDLVSSVARHGFRRMVIVNGHGGNAGIIQVAATMAAEHGVRAVAFSYWNLIAEEMRALTRRDRGGIGHAGEVETSLALYLQPEFVAQELAGPESCADLAAMMAEPFAGVAYGPPDPARESPHGVYGSAPDGRRELGEQVVGLAADRFADYLRQFARS